VGRGYFTTSPTTAIRIEDDAAIEEQEMLTFGLREWLIKEENTVGAWTHALNMGMDNLFFKENFYVIKLLTQNMFLVYQIYS